MVKFSSGYMMCVAQFVLLLRDERLCMIKEIKRLSSLRPCGIFILLGVVIVHASGVLADSGDWVQFYETAQEQLQEDKWNDARANLLKAMSLTSKLDHTDPRYALVLGTLGRVYEHESQFVEAENMLSNAEKILVDSHYTGSDFRDIIFSHQVLLIKTGRKEEAADVNERLRMIFGTSSGRSLAALPDVWQFEYNSGMQEYNASHFAAAQSHLVKSLQLSDQDGADKQRTLKSLESLVALSREQRNYISVDKYMPRLNDLICKIYGPRSPQMGALDESYAQILFKQRRFDEQKHYQSHADGIYNEIASSIQRNGSKLAVGSFTIDSSMKNADPFYSSNLYDFRHPMVTTSRSSAVIVGGKLFFGAQATSSSESCARESQIRAMEQNETAMNASQASFGRGTSYMSRYNSVPVSTSSSAFGGGTSYMSRYNTIPMSGSQGSFGQGTSYMSRYNTVPSNYSSGGSGRGTSYMSRYH
jgi:tetratricopeptide (TPR) repeat protein